MIESGNQIRLTEKEMNLLEKLSGSDAKSIKTKVHLRNFVNAHLVSYPGRTPEELLLRALLSNFLR